MRDRRFFRDRIRTAEKKTAQGQPVTYRTFKKEKPVRRTVARTFRDEHTLMEMVIDAIDDFWIALFDKIEDKLNEKGLFDDANLWRSSRQISCRVRGNTVTLEMKEKMLPGWTLLVNRKVEANFTASDSLDHIAGYFVEMAAEY